MTGLSIELFSGICGVTKNSMFRVEKGYVDIRDPAVLFTT
jgi:hypothetical protein